MSKSVLHTLETRAAEALQAMLAQVSGIRLKAIHYEAPAPDRAVDLRAHVDVYGHSHTLVCKVNTESQPRQVRAALERLSSHAGGISSDATPLLIVPSLAPQTQALCRECNIGYLDLEGNVRLVIDEIFIVRRSQPGLGSRMPLAPAQTPDSSVLGGFPPHRVRGAAPKAAAAHGMLS